MLGIQQAIPIFTPKEQRFKAGHQVLHYNTYNPDPEAQVLLKAAGHNQSGSSWAVWG
jgi:hypothetical protein